MEMTVAAPFSCLFDKSDPNYSKTFKVWHGGRGAAKTVHVAKGLLLCGMESKEKILCTREFQNSISDSVLSTLEDEINQMRLHHFYKVQNNGVFGINGTEFLFRGLKTNIQSLKSIPNITKTWIEEGQTVSERSLEVLIPTVLRTNNSQIIITFNADDEDDAVYKRFVINSPSNAYVRHVNYDENPWFPTLLKEQMEQDKATDTDLYNHVWLGQTRKNGVGSIYGKWMEDMRKDGRICAVPYNPAFPVFTAWDLGFGDSTVIGFFQVVGKEPRLIDCYSANLESLEHYVGIVKAKPYNYECHVFPHDAGHASLRTGTTLVKQVGDLGLKDVEVLPIDAVESGIQLMRALLPQLWISDKSTLLIKAWDKYQYTFDEDKKRFSLKPLHNWCSDFADMGRYAATYLARRKKPALAQPVKKQYSIGQASNWMG